MKKYLTIAAGLIASAALMMAAAPAMAGHVDVGVNIGIPGLFAAPVYVQSRPVYVQPEPVYIQPEPVYVEQEPVYIERERERENDWQERQWDERRHHEGRHDEHRGHDRDENGDHDD